MFGKKLLLITIGTVCTGLGILGVWLPGLPTTIFILIALWAFSRSSEKLHKWVQRLPVLKTALKEARRYERERTVTSATKIVSQSSAWISAAAVTIVTQNLAISGIVIALAVACSVFMYLTPSANTAEKNDVSY